MFKGVSKQNINGGDSEYVSQAQLDFNSDLIASFVNEHRDNKVPYYSKQYDLYKGEHKILWRVGEENKPNNRLMNDYYGLIIDNQIGYFMGKPVMFNTDDEKLLDGLTKVFDENDIDDVNMEVAKEFCIKGTSALMVYQNEMGKTRIVQVPPDEVVFIYNQSDSTRLQYAVRMYQRMVVDKDEYRWYVEIYSDRDVTYFYEGANDVYYLDETIANPVQHIFKEVPFIAFENNKEQMGDLEKIESLVDDFDRTLSDCANEHEAYRRAYLMIKNMGASPETIRRLKEEGIIEVHEDGDVKFITKEIQHEAVKSHLEQLEANIHKFSQVPDLTDESFGGTLSGVAIKFKLFGLETKCIIKERKMRKALKNLVRLVLVPLSIKDSKVYDYTEVNMTFQRNIPANIVEITDMVSKLNGIVDRETLLGLLPFIDDVQSVIDKLDEEGQLAKDNEVDMTNVANPTDMVNKMLDEQKGKVGTKAGV